MKVGDHAIHVERWGGGKPRAIVLVTIVRETPTQWVDSIGTRWRKSDLSRVHKNYTKDRYLMTEEAFKTAGGTGKPTDSRIT